MRSPERSARERRKRGLRDALESVSLEIYGNILALESE
jgi:hypothetical protein